MAFEDHFSSIAQDYAHYRPQYPGELFEYLAVNSPRQELAWDCGTGNGQAAVGLAQYFQRVVATDASAEQIAHAAPHPRVDYRVEKVEAGSLQPGTCDLVTVAVAVHWFDFDPFYRVVQSVLRPGGMIAVWTYHLPVITAEIDQVISKYYREVLAGFWPERIHYLDNRYATLPFPFKELTPPKFTMRAEWTLNQLAGFLTSWSGAQRFMDQKGYHPLKEVWNDLSRFWGEPETRRLVEWPLFMRVGQAG